MAITEISLTTQALDGTLIPSKISTNPADNFAFPGNVSITNNNKFILGNTGNAFLQYNTSVGSLVLNSESGLNPSCYLATTGGLYFNANTKSDGTGSYYPTVDIGNAVASDVQFFTDTNGQISIYPQTTSGFTREASAILQINSITQGFLMPRMTTAQRDAIVSPVNGLQIYNTDSNQPEIYNSLSASWVQISGTISFADDVFTAASSGTGQTFTLSNTPLVSSMVVTHNGLTLRPTTDYTVTGTTLTILENVNTGETIQATYAVSANAVGVVSSLNGLSGNLTLAAGTNITVVPTGNTLTINSTTSAAGANTQVQFNNAGAFGASASFAYNGTSLDVGEVRINTAVSSITTNDGSELAFQPGLDDQHFSIYFINSTNTTTPFGFGTKNSDNSSAAWLGISDDVANTYASSDQVILDLASTRKGFLAPRLTTAQRNAIVTPPTGLLIFNTDITQLEMWNGVAWDMCVNQAGGTENGSLFFYDNTNTRIGSVEVDSGPIYNVGVYADVKFTLVGSVAEIDLNPTSSGGTVHIVDNGVTNGVLLSLDSTTAGFLPPRMTTTQRTSIASPAEGLIVYDLTLHQLYMWNGSSWVILG